SIHQRLRTSSYFTTCDKAAAALFWPWDFHATARFIEVDNDFWQTEAVSKALRPAFHRLPGPASDLASDCRTKDNRPAPPDPGRRNPLLAACRSTPCKTP